jgi:uncharacterized membrane protein (UPF0182 family)
MADDLNKQVDRYESVTKKLTHSKNMVTLLYGDKAYDKLNDYYEAQSTNNKNQISYMRQQVDVLQEGLDSLNAQR